MKWCATIKTRSIEWATLIGDISRRSRNRLHFYDGATPIFETFGVQKQIDDAFHRQVWLKCGGYIVIDETEALVAIDVNTGRNKGGRDVEKTILQTNLEAADEIARQLRLAQRRRPDHRRFHRYEEPQGPADWFTS